VLEDLQVDIFYEVEVLSVDSRKYFWRYFLGGKILCGMLEEREGITRHPKVTG
jgi:hypothetical protein